jgi:hypothetical protein
MKPQKTKSQSLKNIFALTLALLCGRSQALAQAAPIPRPRPLYNADYFYYFTRADGVAPILDNVKGMSNLPSDTLIRFKLVPSKVPGTSTLVQFETVPTTMNEKVVTGKIPLEYIGERMGQRPTVENLKIFQAAMQVYTEKARLERIQKESTMTLDQVLKDFHNQNCGQGGVAKTEAGLKAKWESFIKNTMLSERGKQLATNARTVDLVARTVMFESQREEQLPNGSNSQAIACQEDIIALSVRNRAFSRNWLSYGGEFQGDMAGVTTDAEYNVWMTSKVEDNPYLLGCYQSENYSNSGRTQIYTRIVQQIPKTLGIDDAGKPPVNNNLAGRFEVDNSAGMIPAPKLAEFTHYYHPGGMGRCDVRERVDGELVSGYLRFKKPGATDFQFIQIVNGKVLGQNDLRIEKTGEPTTENYGPAQVPFQQWKISVLQQRDVAGKITWTAVPADQIFGGDVVLLDTKNLAMNFTADRYACLPQGVLPQCFNGKGYSPQSLSAQGVRVPYTWFNKGLRADMTSSLAQLGFQNAEQNFTVPPNTPNLNRAGVPIAIRCVSPGMEDPSKSGSKRYPIFGGPCDTNMMMASGVDQRMPVIQDTTATPEDSGPVTQ